MTIFTENPLARSSNGFEYSDYERYIRLQSAEQREFHRRHLAWFVHYFAGCKKVLDLACGDGTFLDLLREAGIPASGVDADSKTVSDSVSRGHQIVTQDVIEYLNSTTEHFDGVFCSHLIEHLPFETVTKLIQGVSKCILPDGIFVLAFPNPRALRSHLNMFWVDPQHVRFYDGALVKGVLEWSGFTIISDSDVSLAQSDGYRFAPRGLLDAIDELKSGSDRIEKIKSLPISKTRAGVLETTKRRVKYWIKNRMGVTLLAEEITKLNHQLTQVIHLLESPDMEVRLVGKKVA